MEHLHHFALGQDPFQNDPDLRFYFESGVHRRAQLRVDRALRQSKGLVLLVGEGGTGKSLLARRLFEELEEEIFESALMVIMQGTADASSVLRRFAAQIGVAEPAGERAPLIGQIYEQLAIVREDGRHAVLILDDAHVLGREAMAEIASLVNLEYEDRRLISMLLVGLPELDRIVASVPTMAERVDVRVPVAPLGEAEAGAYLAHRIRAAGGDPSLFEPAACAAVYKLGEGRPRRMNALADNALFEAFLAGSKAVGAADVERAGADLALDPGTSPAAAPREPGDSLVFGGAPGDSQAAGAATIALDRATAAGAEELSSLLDDSGAHGSSVGGVTRRVEDDSFAAGASGAAPLIESPGGFDGSADVLELDAAIESDPGPSAAGAQALRLGEATVGDETDADEIDDLFVELLDE